MSASPQKKRNDPLSTVLFDLENLREDIYYLLDIVTPFRHLDKMALVFIAGIKKAKQEQADLKGKKS
jgi:hypothetical protein